MKRLLVSLMLLAGVIDAQTNSFTWVTNNNEITLTSWSRSPTDVVVPDTINGFPVVYFGDIFRYDEGITSIDVGGNVHTISGGAFEWCVNLMQVNLRNVITIEDGENTLSGTFMHTALTNITIPSTVTYIGRAAFRGALLLELDVPETVLGIGEIAFGAEIQLTSIRHRSSTLSPYIYYGNTRLTNVVFDYPINISEFTVAYCLSLTKFSMPTGYTDIGVLSFISTALPEFIVPEGVTNISALAFSYMSTNSDNGPGSPKQSLTNVIFPETLKNLGYGVFWQTKDLKSVYFYGSPPNLETNVTGELVSRGLTDQFMMDQGGVAVPIPGLTLYVPEHKGWPEPPTTFGGIPTEYWTPPPEPFPPDVTNPKIYGVQNYSKINGIPVTNVKTIRFQ